MDRRLILMGIAAAAASGPALAQTAATMGGNPPAASAGAMGPAEMDHAKKTAMAGTASLMEADIGLEKATNAKVKEFAKFEHDEQTTIAEILKSMDPAMSPPKPVGKAATAIENLKEMKAGAAFDKAFVTAQIEGHEMLLAIQEDYLKVGKDVNHVAITKLTRGQIKEHLVLLGDLRKMMS